MEDRPKPFLRLTFDGGRFIGHTLPLDVLAEFAVLQELIDRIAADLYRAQHDRQRVPPGFHDAAKLHLAYTEDNCITAALIRPSEQTWQSESDATIDIFEQAKELAIKALTRGSKNEDLPDDLPESAIPLLINIGRKLGDNENIIVGTGNDNQRVSDARLDSKGRANIVRIVKRRMATREDIDTVPDVVEEIEGEVFRIDDATHSCSLHVGGGSRFNVDFTIVQRNELVLALALRPIRRLRLHLENFGVPSPTGTMGAIREIHRIDHGKTAEVQKTWKRLSDLAEVEDGWFHGSGFAPTNIARATAREVLARLMVSFAHIERPRVYPTPDGGIQAEWVLGSWAADVAFSPTSGSISVEATNADTGEERETTFAVDEVNADDALRLGWWLLALNKTSEEIRHG